MVRLTAFYRLGLVLSGLLMAFQTQAQLDNLFRYNPNQRIFKLWQTSYWAGYVGKEPITPKDTLWLMPAFNRLQKEARDKDDERLYWYAELHKLLIRHHTRANIKDAFSVLRKAEVYLRSCPVQVVQASFWYYYGSCLYGQNYFSEGLRWMLRAQQAFEQIGYQNIPEISMYLEGLGIHFYRFEAYDQFLYYTEQAFRYPFLTIRQEVSTYNNTAMVYLRQKAYAKADSLFRRTIRLAGNFGDTTYAGIAAGEYANSLIQQGRVRQAIPHLYTAYNLCLGEAPERSAIAALYLATALLKLDSTAKAKKYIEKAQRIQTPNKIWADYALAYYQTKTLYERKTGGFARAMFYQDSVMQVKDSLRVLFNSRLVANTEFRTNAERYLNSLKKLETEKQNAILIRNIICVAMLLLTLTGVYALNQHQQKRQKEKEMLLEKQKRADVELAHAKARLDQYMHHLKEKNELIDRLATNLAETGAAESPPSPTKASVPIEDLLRRTLLTEADWQHFKRLFEQVHPGFVESIQQRHLELTPAEVRLLTLSKLDIPAKDMGFILGVSQESVRKARYRLRKKLEQLNANMTLEDLLNGV